MKHGTSRAYETGCRCELCASYQRDRVRRNRAERLESGRLNHATRSAYDAGCRCRTCQLARKQAARRRLENETIKETRAA